MTRLFAFVIRWAIFALAVWVAAELVEGIHLQGLKSILFIALVLGVLNAYVKPLLVLVAFPLMMLTFGLFLVVINTGLLLAAEWLAGEFGGEFGLRFSIDGLIPAVLGAISISIVTFVVTRFVDVERMAKSLRH
ncbi:MAG: phage holin family protein [Chloroflexi bacterium]|nr:phage holin family protein [Chloroflexota bacterium]